MTQLKLDLSVWFETSTVSKVDLKINPGVYLFSVFYEVHGLTYTPDTSSTSGQLAFNGISTEVLETVAYILPATGSSPSSVSGKVFAQIVTVIEPTVILELNMPAEYPGGADASICIFYDKIG